MSRCNARHGQCVSIRHRVPSPAPPSELKERDKFEIMQLHIIHRLHLQWSAVILHVHALLPYMHAAYIHLATHYSISSVHTCILVWGIFAKHLTPQHTYCSIVNRLCLRTLQLIVNALYKHYLSSPRGLSLLPLFGGLISAFTPRHVVEGCRHDKRTRRGTQTLRE